MPKPRTDVQGKRFGRLLVISEAPVKNQSRQVNVLCDCGNTKAVSVSNLVKGTTTSCGCFHAERVTKHGLSQTRLYKIWAGMVDRCANPEHIAFDRYGGAGITVCTTWMALDAFIAWAMANGYSSEKSLDRIKNEQGYSPENCRWTSRTTQQRNRGAVKNSTSQYIGVTLHSATGKWKAYVKHDGSLKHLGYFPTELEAAIARDTYIKQQGLTDFTMNNVL